jgi:hypothetical protein
LPAFIAKNFFDQFIEAGRKAFMVLTAQQLQRYRSSCLLEAFSIFGSTTIHAKQNDVLAGQTCRG